MLTEAELTEAEILALHRALVGIRSVSGEEAAIAEFVERFLKDRGAAAERIGESVLALAGSGPVLLLDTHLDTVPPAPGWQRDPFTATVEDTRVYGLGANDAKAAAAAMIAAFLAVAGEGLPLTVALALVEGEETKGIGTERVLATLGERALAPAAAVVGEPTGLDLAVAEKGLLVLELVARGDACHAAHARALGARNAVRLLARDLVALEALDMGPPHPLLGPATLEPTRLEGGTARNVVPAEARVVLDGRVTPALDGGELARRVRALAGSCEVRVLSDRLKPREVAETAAIVRAARAARPEARLYGSPTLSDWARLDGVPAVKCGPGESRRSHTADEYVLEEEVLAGARFYVDLVREAARLMGGPA